MQANPKIPADCPMLQLIHVFLQQIELRLAQANRKREREIQRERGKKRDRESEKCREKDKESLIERQREKETYSHRQNKTGIDNDQGGTKKYIIEFLRLVKTNIEEKGRYIERDLSKIDKKKKV